MLGCPRSVAPSDPAATPEPTAGPTAGRGLRPLSGGFKLHLLRISLCAVAVCAAASPVTVTAPVHRGSGRERARTRPAPHRVVPSITAVAKRYGLSAAGMIRVAHCESRLQRTATNGQYLGLFQLGSVARKLYLRGDWRDAYANAEAAARLVRHAHGWRPWTCGYRY